MKKKSANDISPEILAAFLDGNATAEESKEILKEISGNADLREILQISRSVDAELGVMPYECEFIPMTAMAATCNEENRCSLECEKYILGKLGIEFDEQQILSDAVRNRWQKKEGTALHNIGRHLEGKGIVVTRQYKCSIEDIVKALNANENVIAAVDGGELLGNRTEEIIEDIFVGQTPDHTVVVIACDTENRTITVFDPNSPNKEDTYSISQFEDAWNDSKNYLVTTNHNDMSTYTPKPIDLSDVELTEDLNDLREAIAENAHDVWAVERMAQGWTYGPQRDDIKKHTPCMVAYSQLPESEKKFDRDMAMNTLKLVRKLGYDLVKREDTELYRLLKQRIQNSKEEFFCPYCLAKGIKTHIFINDIFCNACGHKLDIDWSSYKQKR